MTEPQRPPIDAQVRDALRERCDGTRHALEQAAVEVQRTMRDVYSVLETYPHQGLEAATRPGAQATLKCLDAAKAFATATDAIADALATAERREAVQAQPGLFDGDDRAVARGGGADTGQEAPEDDGADADPGPPVVLGSAVRTCPHGEPLGGVCPRCDVAPAPPSPRRRARGRRAETGA